MFLGRLDVETAAWAISSPDRANLAPPGPCCPFSSTSSYSSPYVGPRMARSFRRAVPLLTAGLQSHTSAVPGHPKHFLAHTHPQPRVVILLAVLSF